MESSRKAGALHSLSSSCPPSPINGMPTVDESSLSPWILRCRIPKTTSNSMIRDVCHSKELKKTNTAFLASKYGINITSSLGNAMEQAHCNYKGKDSQLGGDNSHTTCVSSTNVGEITCCKGKCEDGSTTMLPCVSNTPLSQKKHEAEQPKTVVCLPINCDPLHTNIDGMDNHERISFPFSTNDKSTLELTSNQSSIDSTLVYIPTGMDRDCHSSSLKDALVGNSNADVNHHLISDSCKTNENTHAHKMPLHQASSSQGRGEQIDEIAPLPTVLIQKENFSTEGNVAAEWTQITDTPHDNLRHTTLERTVDDGIILVSSDENDELDHFFGEPQKKKRKSQKYHESMKKTGSSRRTVPVIKHQFRRIPAAKSNFVKKEKKQQVSVFA